MPDRWVCLDVGETLIDETRIWSIWADELRVPRLTFHAALGAVIARGGEHRDVFPMFDADDWQLRLPAVEATYGGFRSDDLYPDALPALEALRDRYRVAVVANQPASRAEELRAIGIDAEVMAMSEGLGVFKPDPAFFARALELMGSPDPADVAYVGDRVDNDVVPAAAAGMRAVWIRRGPWGMIQRLDGAAPALTVGGLDELVARIGEVWTA
ncbi:MAG TPA: HAD family hydrolase [Candidatus Limnocylindrales bacterium]|jgi:HAD superfamily hydrolase (TIGR01549 family)|nr:HAD family hydrolase [Candidatus Limnocylindrales bacterium]